MEVQKMLIDDIVRAQQGDPDAAEALLLKFDPVLKKYSRKLLQEDAYQDLTLALLEMIHTLAPERLRCKEDGALVNYITRAVRNSYLRLLNQSFHQPKISFSLDDTEESQPAEDIPVQQDTCEARDFMDLLQLCPTLTPKESIVLTLVYYWGYSSTEIAKHFSTSKQNINQIKRRALAKLRKEISRSS